MISNSVKKLFPEIVDFLDSIPNIDFDVITQQDSYKVEGRDVYTLSSGFDHITMGSLEGDIYPMPGVNSASVVEWVLFHLISSLARFDIRKDRSFSGSNLSEKRIGIIGMGHIGSKLYHSLYSIAGHNSDIISTSKISNLKDFHDRQIIIVCCSLNQETRNLFNKHNIGSFENLEILVNVARPEIVDNSCIPIETLIIQDFIPETFRSNLIYTNHIAGRTKTVREEIILNFKKMIHARFTIS